MKNISTLTTGQIKDILGISPRKASQLIDPGELEGYRIPRSKDRRASLTALIEFIGKYNFPRTRLLRFLEDHGSTEDQLKGYGVKEPVGRGDIRFYPEIPSYPEKPDILTSGDIAKLCNWAPRTASKVIDNKLNSWKVESDRRTTIDEFFRLCVDSNIPTEEFESITVLSINYAGGWEESQRIIRDRDSGDAVWYRSNGAQEISIRYKKDGLYVKLKDGIYNLILIGMTGREEQGKVAHPKHIEQIELYITKGIELLEHAMNGDNKSQAKKVLEDSQKHLNTYLAQKKVQGR